MRIDAAILTVVVSFLFPLRLLSLVARLNSGISAGDLRRSCAAFAIVAALLAAIFALPGDHGCPARECAASIAVADAGDEGFRREVWSEIEQLKLQLTRMESFWDNNSKASDGKGEALEEDGEVVKAMGLDIQSLIKEQQNIKESLYSSYADNTMKTVETEESLYSSYADSTIKAVETEVQILMDQSRKLNSSICDVWSLAKNTEKTVEALHSDVKKAQILKDESRQMNSDIHQIWSLAKDTEKKVEALNTYVEKVRSLIDESHVYKMWSFAKQTEKKVEDLYSDVKKGFKKKGMKIPYWMDRE